MWQGRFLGRVQRMAWLGLGCAVLTVLPACAELQVGVEVAKRANRAINEVQVAQAETATPTAPRRTSVSSYLAPAPEIFEATGVASWDGRRTLQGIWVAHPLAKTARRVRITNTETGNTVDGALFKRDAADGSNDVLISSEAAQELGIPPNGSAPLRIVAVTPGQRPQPEPVAPQETDVAGTQAASAETASAPQEGGDLDVAAVAPTETAPAAPPLQVETTQPALAETQVPAAETEAANTTPVEGAVEQQPAIAAVAPVAEQAPIAEAPVEPEVTPETAAAPVTEVATVAPRPRPTPSVETAPEEPQWNLTSEEPALNADAPVEAPSTEPAVQPEPEPEVQVAVQSDAEPATSEIDLPFVQAGIFGVAENATRLVDRLEAKGIPAAGRKLRSQGREFTRVIAGPFQTEAERSAAQRVIRDMGMRDATPVRR